MPVIACKCAVCKSVDIKDKRLRTSALVEIDGKNILIDIGPDFREQMLRTGTSHIDAILVTHPHRDHVAGLDDIRSFNHVQGCAMEIYGRRNTIDALKRDYAYVFEPHEFKGWPEANLNVVEVGRTFSVAGGIEVVPVSAMHKDMPVLGYRIADFAYITDANFISEEELERLAGVKLLVINALRKEKHFSHYCLPEALGMVAKIAPQRAFITHMSHQMGFHETVDKELPQNVHLAYDGLTVTL